jgi:hypothetical protein
MVLLFSMLLAMSLRCILGVLPRTNGVGPGGMSMVGGFFVVSRLVMLCRFAVVTACVPVVLRCIFVVLGCFLRHGFLHRLRIVQSPDLHNAAGGMTFRLSGNLQCLIPNQAEPSPRARIGLTDPSLRPASR